jgi:hypothetical protein
VAASAASKSSHAGDVLDDAVACVVPDVHAKGEVRLDFHGQVRLLQVCALAACPHRHLFKLNPHGCRALARLYR